MNLGSNTVKFSLLLAVVLGVLYYVHQMSLKYAQPSITTGRQDIVAVTPWLAPIVWEDTFDSDLLDSIYKPQNITISATVFAVGKYMRFLREFLRTAEQHFFVGYRVTYYVFTDKPEDVPKVFMPKNRKLNVVSVPSSNRWQEISARRMELIQTLIEEKLRNNVDYIFCLDVDSKFHGNWGAESLGHLVAVIHPDLRKRCVQYEWTQRLDEGFLKKEQYWRPSNRPIKNRGALNRDCASPVKGYYRGDRSKFTYERRPISRAYIAEGEGDFYYCGGAFGGSLKGVHSLASTCRANFEADAAMGVEAVWQEESHLNRYMWINKPTKVLSPEYLWQDFKDKNPEIKIIRFSGVVKKYAEVRPNA